MIIDTVIITKNPDVELLSKCIDKILKEAKRAEISTRIIFVDGSKDEAVNYVADTFSNDTKITYIRDTDGNRATARQKGIENVTTSLFTFIDDDVIISDGWFDEMMQYFSSDSIGGVWGAAIPTGKMLKYYKTMANFYNVSIKDLVQKNGSIRGLTHDTMIRTDFVKDIQIPKNLHVMEDHFIREHIESKGKQWLSVTKPYCFHFKSYDSPSGADLDAYHSYKMGTYSKIWFLKHLTLSPFKILYLLLFARDLEIVWYEMRKEYGFTKGILKGVLGL